MSYSIIVNDEICGFFRPARGIREGDPLSLYLFILCMHVLAHRLHIVASEKKSSIGFKVCLSAEKLPCLLFANDSFLFW